MGVQSRGIRPLEHVTNEGDGEPIWVLAARTFVTLLFFPLLVSWYVSSTSTVGIDSSRCAIGLGIGMTEVVGNSSSRHLNRGTMRRQAAVVASRRQLVVGVRVKMVIGDCELRDYFKH